MALSQVYTAVPNDVITAARWNNEFGNIYNNAAALIFPVTTGVSFGGFTITLDNSGVTTLSSSSAQGLSFTPGTKTGTPSTTGNVLNIVSNTFTDTNTAGSGTATAWVGTAIQQPTLAATNATVTTTDAATVYIAGAPANGTNETVTNPWALWVDAGNVRFDGDVRIDGVLTVGSLVAQGLISGLTYSNAAGDAANDITIATGEASSSDATLAARQVLSLTSVLTKQLDASWAVGTNAGGLDTGSVGNSDYYVWLIKRADTGVVDALFSLSATAPTMPTNYGLKRLVGWFKRVGGTNVAFHTYETAGGGLELSWDVPTLDISLVNTLTTSRRTDAVKVPLNFSVLAHLNVAITDSGQSVVWIGCPDHADAAPSDTNAPLANANSEDSGVLGRATQLHIRTSSAGLIAARSNVATIDRYAVSTTAFTWARRN